MKKCYSFRSLFWAYACGSLPLFFFVGMLSVLHVVPVYFNNQQVFGWKGLGVSMLLIPFVALVLAVVNYVVLNTGYYIYRVLLSSFEKKKDSPDMLL